VPENLIRKIIKDHSIEGELRKGAEVALRIDQFLLKALVTPY
jgi:hypothetical protein